SSSCRNGVFFMGGTSAVQFELSSLPSSPWTLNSPLPLPRLRVRDRISAERRKSRKGYCECVVKWRRVGARGAGHEHEQQLNCKQGASLPGQRNVRCRIHRFIWLFGCVGSR